tara:strand:+ start:135 stop:320 length:186 start_codon:yes stop_codon:yes gene_type:complete
VVLADSIPNIAESMGHTPEVHMQNYARFKPSGTKEMYKKANVLAALIPKYLQKLLVFKRSR